MCDATRNDRCYLLADLWMEYVPDYTFAGDVYAGWVYRGQPEWPLELQQPEIVSFLTDRLGWVVRQEAW